MMSGSGCGNQTSDAAIIKFRRPLAKRKISVYTNNNCSALYCKGGSVMAQDKVLIVDDDQAVLKLLGKVVKGNGLAYDTAESGEAALSLLSKETYDLVLLDINLGGMDGFEVLDQIRGKGNRVPVFIISGRKEDYDALYGLGIGADDYITKPFNPVVLGAKVKAMIRRNKGLPEEHDNLIRLGPFTYNQSTLRFTKNGEEIVLTGKENAMMKLFLDNPSRVFSRNLLYDLIWGNDLVDDNAIMVYINHLRQKIEDDPDHPQYIRTIRGIGYRFVI